MGDLNNLTGLWMRTSASGKEYASVQLKEKVELPAGTWLQLWDNDKGDNPKRPDFNLTYTLPDGETAPQQQQKPRTGGAFDRFKNQGQPAAAAQGQQPAREDLPDVDLPF